MTTSSRAVLVGLACVALAVPLTVTLVPPRIGVAPAAACSGTAFMMGSPPGHSWEPDTQVAVSLPANGAALLFHDRKQPFSWPPKSGSEFRLQPVSGEAATANVGELVPGLFAIAPPPYIPKEALHPRPSTGPFRVQWHDGSWKHVTTVRFDAPLDKEAPVIERVGTFSYEDEGPLSSCGSHGPLAHVALSVRDASPVVMAAWKGSATTGAPAAFTAYDPAQPEVIFALGSKDAAQITLVAFDAVGQRSEPVLVALPSSMTPRGPAPAPTTEPPPKRRFGCGKTR